jgi:hypothetical protein
MGDRMAVSARLHAYLALERAMIELDLAADPLADTIRDRMDDVWYALSDSDREWLDLRSGTPECFAGTLPAPATEVSESTDSLVLFPSIFRVLDAAA